jgi:hypothetical protein
MLGDLALEVLGTRYSQEESKMDRAASAGFEGIAQMLLEQKKLMDALEAENRELRRQLADLKRGIGIAVVIDGKTIQLATDTTSTANLSMNSQSQSTLQSLQSLQPPATTTGSAYANRQTGGQQAVGDRQNTNGRSPLADSFVL